MKHEGCKNNICKKLKWGSHTHTTTVAGKTLMSGTGDVDLWYCPGHDTYYMRVWGPEGQIDLRPGDEGLKE